MIKGSFINHVDKDKEGVIQMYIWIHNPYLIVKWSKKGGGRFLYKDEKRKLSQDSGNRVLFRIPSNRRGTLVSVLYENCDHYSL